jgi:hypothetical protein
MKRPGETKIHERVSIDLDGVINGFNSLKSKFWCLKLGLKWITDLNKPGYMRCI